MNGNGFEPEQNELREKINYTLEKQAFKRIVNVVSITLLLHAALYVIYGIVISFIALAAETLGTDTSNRKFEIFSDICGIVMYVLMFLIPAAVIKKFAPTEKEYITFKKSIPPHPAILSLGTLGTVTLFGIVTNLLIILLRYFKIGIITVAPEVPRDTVGTVILIISSVMVPAIVEEILFRKVILNAFMPYGSSFAVTVSAIAFALMHCNPSQFLYAFAAGMIFGYVAVKTGSVFFTMVLHALNNSLSVVYILIYGYLGDQVYSATVMTTDIVLLIFGVIFIAGSKRSSYFSLKSDLHEGTENIAMNTLMPKLKDVICPYSVAYICYVFYLMSKWVYLI